MKNDKEFLEGIYKKAIILKLEKKEVKPIYTKKNKYSFIAVIFIIIPLLLINKDISNQKNQVEAPHPRVININKSTSSFINSNYILLGVVESITKKESKEDFTDIIISLDKVFLGEINNTKIVLEIPSDMELDFIIGQRNLLFLNKKENDIYYLTNESEGPFKEFETDVFRNQFDNEYSLEDIKNNIQGED